MSRTSAFARLHAAEIRLGHLQHRPYGGRPTAEELAAAQAEVDAAKKAYREIMDKEDADWYARRGLQRPGRQS